MIEVSGVSYANDSREEFLPGWSSAFPYICSHAVLDEETVSWHWHDAVELFYIDEGTLEYKTPHKTIIFREGSGGVVNCGIVHMSRLYQCRHVETRLHLFSPKLLAGPPETMFYQKYLAPIAENPSLELLAIEPDSEENIRTLEMLKESFGMDETRFDYPLQVRSRLSALWCRLLAMPQAAESTEENLSNEKIKKMISFIRQNYHESLSVREIAAAAAISERECYRVFASLMDQTPSEYLRGYRISRACEMLKTSNLSIGQISQDCGFGAQPHFGAVFRGAMGCTPGEYRRKNAVSRK